MPLNYLIDANVLLDIVLGREGMAEAIHCLAVFDENDELSPWVAAHTISVIFYVGRPKIEKTAILEWIRESLEVLEMAPLSSAQTVRSFEYGMSDFEDAMQVASALSVGAVGIITHNTKDFRKSPVRSITPREFLSEVQG